MIRKDASGRLPYKKKTNWVLRRRIAFGVAAVLLALGLGIGAWFFSLYSNAAHLNPAPRGTADASVPIPSNDKTIAWPRIDWKYWKEVNPDIIGWVTVPGTSISHAIVQEQSSEKGFYLTHDITRSWNYLGVPYLDADCSGQGLDSVVCPIAGHNTEGTDSVFGVFSSFNDYDFAKKHEVIYLQTPEWNKKLAVQAVHIVPGWESSLATNFSTHDSWHTWWNEQFNQANIKLARSAQASGNLYLFYTCSYFENPANERTLVFAMEPKPTTQSTI